MCVGEKRSLQVPPHLGYGGEGDLHFTIKLLEIEGEQAVLTSIEDEIEDKEEL